MSLTAISIEQIQKVLPHRYPFLLIDRVLEHEPGKRIVALKNITYNEEFFSGHFPGQSVVPGVLLIEAMAQASIMLFYTHEEQPQNKKTYYLGSVKARFMHPVVPGDQLVIVVEPVKLISSAGIVRASATVAGKEVASAEISFTAKENG